MTEKEALSVLRETDKEVVRLSHISAVLGWDQDTVMPISAESERGEQFALLSSIIHQKSTSKELEEAIGILSDWESGCSSNISNEQVSSLSSSDFSLSLSDKALLRYWKKELRNSKRLSSKLVHELSLATNNAHHAWVNAREKSDFSIFEPALKKVIDLTKEKMSLLSDGRDLYDTALDLYEEGMDRKTIDSLFDELESTIHGLMDKLDCVQVDDSFLFKKYKVENLHGFCLNTIDRMGFDHNRGIVGITPHPYTTSLGVDDHRISTRYTDDGLFDPIGSIIHETGHALYELCASSQPLIRGTSIGQGVSMGIHESQSRFWENIMGRSRAFWKYQYPLLQKEIDTLKDVDLDSFVRAINKSKPSAIRVNADELTYNLHIILRYRIEKELFDGTLSVHDLPVRWNELSKDIIRYEVKNDSEGVLQDVHWSQGDIGYFPTYAIGNIYSAAFYFAMCNDLGGKERVDNYLSSGDYSKITSWQCDNIWKWGGIYPPSVLLERVTHSKVDVEPFKEYLVTKFSQLYLR